MNRIQNRNSDLPGKCLARGPPECFPEATIKGFETLHTSLCNKDGSSFVDENDNHLFKVIVPDSAKHAYRLVRPIREAIYGQVWHAIILEPISSAHPQHQDDDDDDDDDDRVDSYHERSWNDLKRKRNLSEHKWCITDHQTAIKIINLSKLNGKIERKKAETPHQEIAENPHQEIRVMEYIRRRAKEMDTHTGAHTSVPTTTPDTDYEPDFDPASSSIDELRELADLCIRKYHMMTYIEALCDQNELCIVMPFCKGGELSTAFNDSESHSESQARVFMSQLLVAVEFLQKARLCHRDLSAENILVTHDCSGRKHLVVIDFGMCVKVPYDNKKRCLLKYQCCGKIRYMAPEVFNESNRAPLDGHAIDIWALGPILYYMIDYRNQWFPWDQPCEKNAYFQLFSRGGLKDAADSWRLTWSNNLKDLLQGMFWKNYKHRLSLEQIKAHPWMNETS